jgi:uncharacterized protein (TIGR03118 family)
MKNIRSYFHALVVGVVLLHLPTPSGATSFTVNNLVTDDQAANSAQITDSGLVNAWGLSFSPTSPFWVSANGTGTSVLYQVDPATQVTTKQGLVVSIPGAGNVTGQVFNGTSAFNSDRFLFVSEDGTVSGWRGALGTNAETLALASPTNVYKGSALGNVSGNSYLYAANFKANSIDVFKGTAGAPDLPGHFTDPNLPAGYTPFNIQNLNGNLYVTYAVTDGVSNDELQGLGLGIVDKFDLEGNLLGRVATGGTLNAPWGLAIAPSSFEAMAGDLLVGNFGDGRINVFDPLSFAYLGQILDAGANPLTIDGLWALSPGNNGLAGSSDMLYFTAGPNDESHGVFGVLTAVPEPSTYALMLAGVLGLLIKRRAVEP